MFSSGIKKLIDAEPELAVIGWETDLEEAIRQVQAMQPDVILVVADHRLGGKESARWTTFPEQVGGKAKLINLNLEDGNTYFYAGKHFTINEVGDLRSARPEHKPTSGSAHQGSSECQGR